MEITAGTVPQQKVARKSMRRLLTWAVVVAGVIVVAAYFGISAYIANKLSHPNRQAVSSTPAQYGLKYEDVQFPATVDGIQLKGWFIDSPGSKTIIMMHGRQGVRDDKGIGMMDVAKALAGHNYDLLMFDFRAHGQSAGTQYSLGQWETWDVAGAVNYLKGRGVTEMGAIGWSMGAATLINATPDIPDIKAVVADSAFADLGDLLDVQLPKASGLPSFFNPGIIGMENALFGVDLLANKPENRIAQFGSRPVLLIHIAADDATIPTGHVYRLQKAAANDPNAQLWVAPGTGHAQAFKKNSAEYLKRVTGFFDTYLK